MVVLAVALLGSAAHADTIVAGTIRHNETGGGVPGVSVRVETSSGQLAARVETDSAGRYTVTLLSGYYYDIRPVLAELRFDPESSRIYALDGEQQQVDFVAFPSTPVPPDVTTPPSAPTNLELVTIARRGREVLLRWVDTSGVESGFRVEQYSKNFGWLILTQISGANVTEWQSSLYNPQPGRKYTLRVVAVNAIGAAASDPITIKLPKRRR
jgi:hypothetical protein